VRRIVSAHGGEISLQSDSERGTRAVLRLPTMADAAAATQVQAADEAV
jgi:signal transduction histidine kinase